MTNFEIVIKEIHNVRVVVSAENMQSAIEKAYNGDGNIVFSEFYDYLADSARPYPK